MSSVIETTPANLEVDVKLNVLFKVEFDTDIDTSTVSEFTLILAETNSEVIIPGQTGYVYGTKTATFQLFDYLKEDTEYTFIIVGGSTGILTRDQDPAIPDNLIIRFRTGTSIDPNQPLAKQGFFDGTQPFLGEDGIYQQVYDRNSEPISHIVTTAGSVGPSGNIIPEGYQWDPIASGVVPDGSIYLPPSGTIEPVVLETDPVDNAVDVVSGDVTITFDIPVTSIVDDDYITITAENFSGLFSANDVVYTYSVASNVLSIDISNFEGSVNYVITLGNGYSFSFRSLISPFFTTVSTIRSQLGNLIVDITDEEIEFLIYKYSYYLQDTYDITDPPQNAAIRYVICAVKLDLIKRRLFEGGPVTRKRLADLEIDRGRTFAENIGSLIKELEICLVHEGNELAGKRRTAVRSAVRGYNDARAPIRAGSWTRLTNNDF